MQQRLVAIGDSITLGHWDPEGGWVAQIRRVADEEVVATRRERYRAVYNLGVSSNTSADVLARYPHEVSARFPGTPETGSAKEEAFVVLAVGINDSQLKDGRELVGIAEYRENMKAIIRQGLELGHRIVVVGLTGVLEELTDPVGWDTTKAYRNERIAEFDSVVAALAQEHDLPFADLFSVSEFQASSFHLDWDGLHLNPQGHQRVATVVEGALGEAGWRAR